MPARASSRAAFTVRSSGSPGPAPTKYTLPITRLPAPIAGDALPEGNARTSAGSRDGAAELSWKPRCHHPHAAVLVRPPATPATARTQGQIAFRAGVATAARVLGFCHLSK